MYLISLIFIPDIISAICIILSMLSIMIGMVGFMHIWGLSLSSITMIEVIMCVGFCIDFSAHLTHAFIAGVGKGTRNERAYKACVQTGVPILNSALSTIIGVLVLGFSDSYVFLTFFKTLILIMSLGVFTSMLFLPVLLSLIGPNWKIHKENKSINKINEPVSDPLMIN
jgi:predicted RND superfamily exporter protein